MTISGHNGGYMAIREGLRRIVKVISALAWICAIIAFGFAILTLFGGNPSEFWGVIGAGAIVFAVAQGTAWIIAGFSGNQKESDGLVRWTDLWIWRKKSASPARPDLVGVSGWLAWLSICLLVLCPLALFGSTFRDIQDTERLYPLLTSVAAWENFKILYWAITASAIAVSIAAGYRLRNVIEPGSVTFAKIALWIIGPGFVLASVIIAYISFGERGGATVLDASIKSLFGSIFSAIVWTLYLKWSHRVRNTYFYQLSAPVLESKPTVDRREPTL
jgi:hypothetical protein